MILILLGGFRMEFFMPTARCRGSESRVHLFLSGKPRMTVNDSINGAVRRLARPACQQLFTDFTDSDGRALSETLTTWGKSPADALLALYFVDGGESPQCRDETTAAYTRPRSRVIYVCGARFAELFARKTTGGEVLLIHEFLHVLGLGENPPTSAQITSAVYTRCGV